ncbi:MAG: hypothetical protein U0736_04670 [Gemmataceae bacterium]
MVIGIRFSRLVVAVGLLILCACGDSGPKRYRVAGTVRYKDQPLKSGLINFIPDGAQSPAGGAPIVDGRYEIAVARGLLAGKYRVSISAPTGGVAVKEGEAPGVSGKETRETLPARYNTQSELTAEIKPGAATEFPFDLK